MKKAMLPRRRMLLAAICSSFAITSVLTSCGRQEMLQASSKPAPDDGGVQLSVSGSSTLAPLLTALARNFEALYPHMRIAITTGGTTRGISDVRSGASDIGMASRNLTDGELDLQSFPIARDGVAVVVSSANPVRGMTYAQLRSIYIGQIRSWEKIGGADAPITVVAREKGRGAQELAMQYLGLNAAALHADRVAGENQETFGALVADPNAVAFVSVGEAMRRIAAGMPIRLLEIDGMPATAAIVGSGDYPVVRPLALVTRATPSGAVKQFIDFCLSSQATEEVRKFDFIPYLD